MGVIFYKRPRLKQPDMVASWPGIGNIGLIAVDTLRSQLQAEELGEIEPWDFFYPKKVIFRTGLLEELEFPGSRFYFKRLAGKDLIFFIGEEQPPGGERGYAEGRSAYEMASLVLNVAEKFGCRRVYTSGAAVALTHHQMKPRVWTVASDKRLIGEIKSHPNAVTMSEMLGKSNLGSITGMNGLLLGLAKERGLEAICLMGEIPDYLSGAPFPYPRASRSVLEVLTERLGVQADLTQLSEMDNRVGQIIDEICDKLPQELKEKIEQRKLSIQREREQITEEDERWLREHIDELFKGRGRGDEKPT